MSARRDIRRFRADPVPEELLARVVAAAHTAPSVGHSQPWRFVIVSDPATRARASVLADRSRLTQAAAMTAEAGRHLLDLDLEGIREAPLGLVVCCDRRVPAEGVLGRATFRDADLWSCACAIQNLWLAARAEGLGVGWVTLFEPGDLAALIEAPQGVATLGWLCIGWPDERPPSPGLERRGWSERIPLDGLVRFERWNAAPEAPPPRSRLALPSQAAVVAAHDTGDRLLSPPGSLGVLDRAVDRVLALGLDSLDRGTLVLVAADHPVTARGVSAYPAEVTRHVAEAALAGTSVGAVAAREAGLDLVVVDAGVAGEPLAGAEAARPQDPQGDLECSDALSGADVRRLVEAGATFGRGLGARGVRLVALGEVGVGNTTVAAALAAALLRLPPDGLVGLGAGSDSAIVAVKQAVVAAALARWSRTGLPGSHDPHRLLAALGGGEVAFLAGLVVGAADAGAAVILDGMVTGVAALVAVEMEPAAAFHLIAGQRSREPGHPAVLQGLGLEPLLDIRLRAGEGVGAALATTMVKAGLHIRRSAARTAPAVG